MDGDEAVRRIGECVAAVLVAATAGGCSNGSTAPGGGPPPDVSGAWALGQHGTFSSYACRNTGAVSIHQNGSSFTATYSTTGTCQGPNGPLDNSGSGTITDGQLNGSTIHFSLPECAYTGTVVGTPPDGASGTVTCRVSQAGQVFQFSGTWHVSHGVASVVVSPNPALVAVTATLPLTATAYDAAGNVLAGRRIVWSSLTPAVATADNGQLAGVALGGTAVTATTVPILALEDSVSGMAQVQVVHRFTSVVAGYLHSCGLLLGGVGTCWGPGYDGRLGNGTTTSTESPAAVVGGLHFAQISGGFEHSCGVTTSGAANCWGKEISGELGDGNESGTQSSPVAVSGGLAFTSVSAGDAFSCGVTTSGAGYCWGWNADGRLGNGSPSTTAVTTPTAVAGNLTFGTISVTKNAAVQPLGNGFACGLTTSGAAYCWGWNGEGELGDSSGTGSAIPVPVAGGRTFTALSVGEEHACGITTTGAAYCWGQGSSGQLGNGHTTGSNVPVPVAGGLTFTSIAAGGGHTCGVTTSGAAYCWGGNGLGALGIGSFAPDFSPPDSIPVPVVGGLTFASVTAGVAHTCGLTTSGVVYCWGRGFDGELGNGTLNNQDVPTLVSDPLLP